MRFRLATLLMFVTFVAVTVGLSYQVVVLRQEVRKLRQEVQSLYDTTSYRGPGSLYYRMYLTSVGVPYSVEEAMMGDVWSAPARL